MRLTEIQITLFDTHGACIIARYLMLQRVESELHAFLPTCIMDQAKDHSFGQCSVCSLTNEIL